MSEAPAIEAVAACKKYCRSLRRSMAYGLIDKYIVDLVFATRYPERYSEELRKWIQVGASPRGAIGLDKTSRAHAWLEGRHHVTPEDVRAVVHDVFRHRLILSFEANAEGISANRVIDEIVKQVAVA